MAHANHAVVPYYSIPLVEVDDADEPVHAGEAVGGAIGARYALEQWGQLLALALTNVHPWPAVSPYTTNVQHDPAPVGVAPDAARNGGDVPPDPDAPSTEQVFEATAEEYRYWVTIALDVMHRASAVQRGAHLTVNRKRKLAGLLMQAAINGVMDSDMFEEELRLFPGGGGPGTARRDLLEAVVRDAAGGDTRRHWESYRDDVNAVAGGVGGVDWEATGAARAVVAVLGSKAVKPIPLQGARPPRGEHVAAFRAVVQDAVDEEPEGDPARWYVPPRPADPALEQTWLRDVVDAFSAVGVPDVPINADPVHTPEAPSTGVRCVLVRAALPVKDMPPGSMGDDLVVQEVRDWLARAVNDVVVAGATARPLVFFTASDAAVTLFVVSPATGVSVFVASAGTADAQSFYKDGTRYMVPRGAPHHVDRPVIRWRLHTGVTNGRDPAGHMGVGVDVDPAEFDRDPELGTQWARGVITFCLGRIMSDSAHADQGPTGQAHLPSPVGVPLCNMTDLYAIEVDEAAAWRRQLMTAALAADGFADQQLFGCLFPVAWSRAALSTDTGKLSHPCALVDDVLAVAPQRGLQPAVDGPPSPVPTFGQVDNTMAAALQRVFLATHGYSPLRAGANVATLIPDVVAACSSAGYPLGAVHPTARCANHEDGAGGDRTAFSGDLDRDETVGTVFGPRPFLPLELQHAMPNDQPAYSATTRYFEYCRATAHAAYRAVGTAAAEGIDSMPFRDHADAVVDMVSGIVTDFARPAFEWVPRLEGGSVEWHDTLGGAHTMTEAEARDVLYDALARAGANLVGSTVAAASEPVRGGEGHRAWTSTGGNTELYTAHAFADAAAEFVRAALRAAETSPLRRPARPPGDGDSDAGDTLHAEETKALEPPPAVTDNFDADARPNPVTLRRLGLVLFNNYMGRATFQDTARMYVVGTNLPREAMMYTARALGSRLMAFDTEIADEREVPTMDDLEETRGIAAFLVNAALARKPHFNDALARQHVAGFVRAALHNVDRFGRGFVVPTAAAADDVAKLQAVYDAWVGPNFADFTRMPPGAMKQLVKSSAADAVQWKRPLGDTVLHPGRQAIHTNGMCVATQWQDHLDRVFTAYTEAAVAGKFDAGADTSASDEARAIRDHGAAPSLDTLRFVMSTALFPSQQAPHVDGDHGPAPIKCMGTVAQATWRPLRFLALGPKTAYSCHFDEHNMVMRALASGVVHTFPINAVPLKDPADAPLPPPRPAPGDAAYDEDEALGPFPTGPHFDPAPAATPAEHLHNHMAFVALGAMHAGDHTTSAMPTSTTAVLDNIMHAWSADNLCIHTVLFDPNHVLGAASGPQWALIRPDKSKPPDAAAQTSAWANRVAEWGLYYARMLRDPHTADPARHPSLDPSFFGYETPAGDDVDDADVAAHVHAEEGGDAADPDNQALWGAALTRPEFDDALAATDDAPHSTFHQARPAAYTPDADGFCKGHNFVAAGLYIHPRLRGLRGRPTPAVVQVERDAALAIEAAGGDAAPAALRDGTDPEVAAGFVARRHYRNCLRTQGVSALEAAILSVLRQAVTAVLDVVTVDADEAHHGGHQTTAPQDVIAGLAVYSHGGAVDATVHPVAFATPTPDGWRATQQTAIVAVVDTAMPGSRNVLDNASLAVAALHAGIRTAFLTTAHNTMAPRAPPPNVDLLATYVANEDMDALVDDVRPMRRRNAARRDLLFADPVNAPAAHHTVRSLLRLAADPGHALPVHAGMPAHDAADGFDAQALLEDVMKATTAESTMFGRFATTICGRVDGESTPHYLTAMHTAGHAVAVVQLRASPFLGYNPLDGVTATAAAARATPPGTPTPPVKAAAGLIADLAMRLADAATASDVDTRIAAGLYGLVLGTLHALAGLTDKPPAAVQLACLVRSATSYATYTLHTSHFRHAIRPDPERAHVMSYNGTWADGATVHVDMSFAAAVHAVFAGVIHKTWNIRSFCKAQSLPWAAAVQFNAAVDAAAMRAAYTHYLRPMDPDRDDNVYPVLPSHWSGTVTGFQQGENVVVDPVAASAAGPHAMWGATVGRLAVPPTRERGRTSAAHLVAGDETLDSLGLLAAYAVHVQPFYGDSSHQVASTVIAEPRPALVLADDPRPPATWAVINPDADSKDAPSWCTKLARAAARLHITEPFQVAAFVMTQFLLPFTAAPGVKDAFGRLPATALTIDGVGTGDGADPKFALFPLATATPVFTLVMPPPVALANTIADLVSYVYALVAALPRAQRAVARDTMQLIVTLTLFRSNKLGVSAAPHTALAPHQVPRAIRLSRSAAVQRLRTLFRRRARTLMEAHWTVLTPVISEKPARDGTIAMVTAVPVNAAKREFAVTRPTDLGFQARVVIDALRVFNADTRVDVDAAKPTGLTRLPVHVTATWTRSSAAGITGVDAGPMGVTVDLEPGYVYACTLSYNDHAGNHTFASMPTLTALHTGPRNTTFSDPEPTLTTVV